MSKPTQNPALEAIKQKIVQNGPIRFDDFMQMVLYDPYWGYYSQAGGIFGSQGDFVTAPELTSLFGYTIALAILPVLQAGTGTIYEFGAGRGKLALDILSKVGNEIDQYTIVELSAGLKDIQKKNLHEALPGHLFSKVNWISELPETLNGLVLGNELLDAIPVRRFKWSQTGTTEAYVSIKNQELEIVYQKASAALESKIQSLHSHYGPWPEGFESEWPEQACAFVSTVTEKLKGACIMIDYGMNAQQYYQATNQQGHLRAHSRHTAHDGFLANPGLQDLTSHVNFSTIYDAVIASKGQLEGYCSQANFLIHHGLMELAEKEPLLTDPAKGGLLRQALHTLTSEAAMGLSFKVMCWSKQFELPESKLLTGFLRADLSHQL